MHEHVHVYIHVCIHAYMYLCVYVYVHVPVFVYVCVYLCLCTWYSEAPRPLWQEAKLIACSYNRCSLVERKCFRRHVLSPFCHSLINTLSHNMSININIQYINKQGNYLTSSYQIGTKCRRTKLQRNVPFWHSYKCISIYCKWLHESLTSLPHSHLAVHDIG